MAGEDPFSFYEVVCVTASDPFPDLVGHSGYVAGKSWRYEEPTPHGPVDGYGVMLFDEERVYFFKPQELRSSGYFLATEKDDRGDVRPVEISPV